METYALYAQVLNDQQVMIDLDLGKINHLYKKLNTFIGCAVQEFDRADALYQQGMKVDPGNANLLVREPFTCSWLSQSLVWVTTSCLYSVSFCNLSVMHFG